MNRHVERLASEQFDLLVIGGGINGAAITHMAALNGLRVALIEKRDFASGTSSKSSKLIHGGLRYLENFEFDLVAEALKERTIQLQAAPHLVKPLGFIIPLYKKGPRPAWMMKVGVGLYDFLSGRHLIYPHRSLSKEEVLHFIPSVNPEGLIGGLIYFDAQMDDARLCLENVLRAEELGAVVENYVQLKAFIKENGKTVGIIAQDRISGRIFEIRAKRFVSATGVWSDELMLTEGGVDQRKIRMTKGVHLVTKKKICDHALLLQTVVDKRIFFVIPWLGETLIGTTDTDYEGRPDDVAPSAEDIKYLIDQVNLFFPNHELKEEDIVSTFAGLRPLVSQDGSPSGVSRKHVIRESFSGIVYVMGGKYTTYRKIAEDTLKVLLKPIVPKNNEFKLFGHALSSEEIQQNIKEYGLTEETIKYLHGLYGQRYHDILKLTRLAPQLKERIYPDRLEIKAQVVYALNHEKANNIDDVFERRLNLHYLGCDREQFKQVFADLSAKS